MLKIKGHTLKSNLHIAKNSIEFNRALSEVCGEFKVDSNWVSFWTNRFRGSRGSLDQESRKHQRMIEM